MAAAAAAAAAAGFRYQEEAIRYRIGGRPVRQWRVQSAVPDETMTGDELAGELKRWLAANPNTDARVAIRLPGIGWRSAPAWWHAGDDVELTSDPDLYDMVGGDGGSALDAIEEAIIIARRHVTPAGGCRPGEASKRDCFWRCLSRAMCGKLPAKISSDAALRKLVAAPPPGQLFPATPEILRAVEAALPPDMALIVTGDANYTSGKKRSRVVHLRLRSEHYDLRCPEGRTQTRAIDKARESKPLRAAVFGTIVELVSPDGERAEHSLEQVLEWLRKPFNSPYVIIKTAPGSTAAETLEDWAAARDALLPMCHLDLFHYSRHKDFALELFRHLSMTIPAAAPLSAAEEEWVAGAMRGGLIFGEAYSGRAVGIDVRSAYPAAMASKLILPIGAGRFQILEELPATYLSVGIYRAVVTIPDANKRLFRLGGKGASFYTHLDLTTARALGGTVKLVRDGAANACLYTPENGRLPAYQIFGEFVAKLYAAKQAAASLERPAARAAPKRVLNILWGALCERTKEKHIVLAGSEGNVPDEILDWGGYSDGGMWFKTRPKSASLFVGAYPRFAPFIMARVRSEMATMLLPHVGALKRIHTDGAVLALPELPADLAARVGEEIGSLKIEHDGDVVVKNAMRVKWS